jgi:hypothetical protein
VGQRDDDLMRHFGTLWKTAMVGLDTLREVAVRSTEAGRLRVDVALLQRERAQLLETLGEMIVSMIDDQSFEDVPESVKQTYARIKDVDQRIRRDDTRVHDNASRGRGFEPEAADDYGSDDLDGDSTGPAAPQGSAAPEAVPHR